MRDDSEARGATEGVQRIVFNSGSTHVRLGFNSGQCADQTIARPSDQSAIRSRLSATRHAAMPDTPPFPIRIP